MVVLQKVKLKEEWCNMGGMANHPSSFINTAVDPRLPQSFIPTMGYNQSQLPQQFMPNVSNISQLPQPFIPTMGYGQPQQSSGGVFSGQPLQQYNQQNMGTVPFNQNQVYAGGTPNFDERTGTYINPQQPKPRPLPGRRIIDPPRPVYGQRPQRGPVPRDMTPVTLQQGLGGLGALPITNQQIG